MDTEQELLPCPFCGSQPSAYVGDPGAPFAGGYFTIECPNTECPVEACVSLKRRTDLPEMTHQEAEESIWPTVRAIWNRRAEPGHDMTYLIQITQMVEDYQLTDADRRLLSGVPYLIDATSPELAMSQFLAETGASPSCTQFEFRPVIMVKASGETGEATPELLRISELEEENQEAVKRLNAYSAALYSKTLPEAVARVIDLLTAYRAAFGKALIEGLEEEKTQ